MYIYIDAIEEAVRAALASGGTAAADSKNKNVAAASKEKKKRGEHSSYTAQDRQWEENLRKELDVKKRKVIRYIDIEIEIEIEIDANSY